VEQWRALEARRVPSGARSEEDEGSCQAFLEGGAERVRARDAALDCGAERVRARDAAREGSVERVRAREAVLEGALDEASDRRGEEAPSGADETQRREAEQVTVSEPGGSPSGGRRGEEMRNRRGCRNGREGLRPGTVGKAVWTKRRALWRKRSTGQPGRRGSTKRVTRATSERAGRVAEAKHRATGAEPKHEARDEGNLGACGTCSERGGAVERAGEVS
jgi:hypothetical protein